MVPIVEPKSLDGSHDIDKCYSVTDVLNECYNELEIAKLIPKGLF